MKTTCIATVAIFACASAAPQRMRRTQDEISSMPAAEVTSAEPTEAVMSMASVEATVEATVGSVATTVAPGVTDSSPIPDLLSMPEEVEGSMPGMFTSGMGSVPDEVHVEEVLWESLSMPSIFEELHGESMSMPEGWTPEEEGYVATETGGYVEPGAESDDPGAVSSEDMGGEVASADDIIVEDEATSSASGAIVSGVISAACVASAIALF